VGSGRGWLGVVVARQADLSGWLGAMDRCALAGGVLVILIIQYKVPMLPRKYLAGLVALPGSL